MSYHLGDTIAAVGTAPGGAARGMVRVSGPDAVGIVGRCFSAEAAVVDDLRSARVVTGSVRVALRNPPLTPPYQGGEFVVPCELFLWPTARSYTREPVAELHTIGSPPLLTAVMAAVCAAGARPAEPGEYTLRAFLAGRIDLTQAEAVLGVIDARSQAELTASLGQLAGGLARPLVSVRDDLLQLLAELEAGLDFVEEDIRFIATEELAERLDSAEACLRNVAAQMALRTTTTAEQVVLVGPPNVGKSSLFNTLVKRWGAQDADGPALRAALVSAERGTTRDYLTATIVLEGVCVELVDTAGVEQLGTGLALPEIDDAAQALSRERREGAAIRVWCTDAMDVDELPADCELVVLTKDDVVRRTAKPAFDPPRCAPIVATSSCTGAGLNELRGALARLIMQDTERPPGAVVAATADRCRESVRLAQLAVEQANGLVRSGGGDELVAAEVRGAVTELGKVVGAVYTDDLLDRIFSTFCVGK